MVTHRRPGTPVSFIAQKVTGVPHLRRTASRRYALHRVRDTRPHMSQFIHIP